MFWLWKQVGQMWGAGGISQLTVILVPRYFLLFLQECRLRFLSEKNIYVIIQYRYVDMSSHTRKTSLQKVISNKLVVHQSSETSTNQSNVIIRSDDRFLNLVVDSDSIVFKYICLTLFFFFCLHTDKNITGTWVQDICFLQFYQ